MGLFDSVNFGPEEIRATVNGQGRAVMAVLTSQTCGEACWCAREEVCRCSCGGRNHGCLRDGAGERPERTSKIDGVFYKLHSTGLYGAVCSEARAVNKAAGYRSLDKPTFYVDGKTVSEAEADEARKIGIEVRCHQYYYTWRDTDGGAPARVKRPTASQLKWPELAGANSGTYVLWVRTVMPERPKELKRNRDGTVAEHQNPT